MIEKNLDQLGETAGRHANTEGAPREEEVRGMAEKAVIMVGMGGKNINAKGASGEGSRGNGKHDMGIWQKGDPC